MSRIVYVNGRYLPYREAGLPIEDRAILFGDAVYEVCQIKASKIIDMPRHFERLWRSMNEIGIELTISRAALEHIVGLTCRKNRVINGMVYLQITRGVARRDFLFPSNETVPSILCFARSISVQKALKSQRNGIRVVTLKDQRWDRVDVKTTNLLASVLARQTALLLGAQEAWLTNSESHITEGAASNAWILTKDNILYTHPINGDILKGITRDVLIDLCNDKGIKFQETSFSINEALQAKEAFVTAATNILTPVVAINGEPIADGKPGPLTNELRLAFHEMTNESKF